MTQQLWQRRTDRGTVADSVAPHPEPSQTRYSVEDIREDAASLRDRTRVLHDDTSRFHQRVRREDLDQRTASITRRDLAEVLSDLHARGFAWRDLARIAGVSVPALRKWRQGESATPENRRNVARFLAVCEYLEQAVPVIADVASWFEIPLVDDAPVTPLAMYADGRHDLVLDYAEQQEMDPVVVLDKFDSTWRTSRSEFEVIRADDGLPTIQHRPV